MALTDLQRLRLAIADRYRSVMDETIGVGDGKRTVFQTHLAPVLADSESVTLNWEAFADPADYGMDDEFGIVTCVVAPTALKVLRISYKWSAFSDEELEDLLELKGSVEAAALTALEWVMADVDRWMRYFFGQEMVDRSAGVDAINRLIDSIRRSVGAPAGVVRATTTALETALEPFIEQEEDVLG